MPTIGIAIPCYKPHHHFLTRLINSIVAQTRRPDQVVISCSSWDHDGRQEFDAGGIPVTIVYAKRRIVQAENRNIAASLLNTDILSFIDADDIMHPRRTEYILRTFQETQCDGVVHNYQHVKHESPVPFETEDAYVCVDEPVIKNPTHLGCIVGNHALHHAHLSIMRNVFARFQYPIEEQFYRIEDAVYLGTLVQNGLTIRYLQNKLSQYFY